jgi:hypothetical protein
MIALLAVLALQPDAETIRQYVQRYAKDKSLEAKAEILKAGKPAIRVLYEERATAEGERFDELSDVMLTLRFKDEKDPRAIEFRDSMARRMSYLRNRELKVDELAYKVLRDGVRQGEKPVFYPYIDPDVEALGIQWKFNEEYPLGKAYLELDRALAPHKLDWAYRYGVLLISTPGKLWPAAPTGRTLTADEQARLKKLIADLDAPEIDAREKAVKEIPAFGPDAIPLLKATEGSADAKARALDLLKQLDERFGAPVWDATCAMDRQSLSAKDQDVANTVNGGVKLLPDNASFDKVRLDAVAGMMSRWGGLTIEVPELIADFKVTIAAHGLPLRDALMLMTKTHGLDFYVTDTRLRIDIRSNVEKVLGK